MSIEKYVQEVKEFFEKKLSEKLSLQKVYAPLFLAEETGLNDNLSGSEKAVSFSAKDIGDNLEIVHSLAKWKRRYLGKNKYEQGKGIITDMKAIRKDEALSCMHSILVDQWDWELHINKEHRTIHALQMYVLDIYGCLRETQKYTEKIYFNTVGNKIVWMRLPKEIFFITTQELEDLYPLLSPKEREDVICKDKGAVFLMQIGHKLKSGIKHDDRAADYDDWTLNGDILVWHNGLQKAFELSSMGIRVDAKTLFEQCQISKNQDRLVLPYHQAILNDQLPFTIGGGIGQSRVCMYMLQCMHIGQVQASIWPQSIVEECKKQGIELL